MLDSDEGNSTDDNGADHCDTDVDRSDEEADDNNGDSLMWFVAKHCNG